MKVKYEDKQIIIEPENSIDRAYLNQFDKPEIIFKAEKSKDTKKLEINRIMVVR